MDQSQTSMMQPVRELTEDESKLLKELFYAFTEGKDTEITVFDSLKIFETTKAQFEIGESNQEFRNEFVRARNPITNRVNFAQLRAIFQALLAKHSALSTPDSALIHRSTSSKGWSKGIVSKRTSQIGKWFGLVDDDTPQEWEQRAIEKYFDQEGMVQDEQVMGNFMTDIDSVALKSQKLGPDLQKRNRSLSRSVSRLQSDVKTELDLETGEERLIIPGEVPIIIRAGEVTRITPSDGNVSAAEPPKPLPGILAEKQQLKISFEAREKRVVIEENLYDQAHKPHEGKDDLYKAPADYVNAEWFGADDREVSTARYAMDNHIILKQTVDRPPVSAFKTKWMTHQKSKLKSIAGIPLKHTMKDEHYEKLLSLQRNQTHPYFNAASLSLMLILFIVEIIVQRGFSKVGVSITEVTDWIDTFGYKQNQMEMASAQNLFIGPDSFTLLKMGAKYAPCMKENQYITLNSRQIAQVDNTTQRGACIMESNRTCAYITEDGCRVAYANIPNGNEGSQGLRMASGAPTLPDFNRSQHFFPAQTCAQKAPDYEVALRPCCISIRGQCVLLSKEQCKFLSGHYHKKLESCNEVKSCLGTMCGMGGFGEKPMQFWRLITPIFLHVGILHLFMNALFQLSLLKMETSIGSIRFGIIFFISGIGGNLVSGIFSPLSVQVGSSGALYGLMAIFLIDIFQYWTMIPNVGIYTAVMGFFLFVSLMMGTIRYIDNFAHFGGFLYGLVAAIVFLPHITFGKADVIRKRIVFSLAVPVLILLSLGGVLVFYLYTGNFCPQCTYINCIPYTKTACENIEIDWKGEYDPINWCNNRLANNPYAFSYALPTGPTVYCEANYSQLSAFAHDL